MIPDPHCWVTLSVCCSTWKLSEHKTFWVFINFKLSLFRFNVNAQFCRSNKLLKLATLFRRLLLDIRKIYIGDSFEEIDSKGVNI